MRPFVSLPFSALLLLSAAFPGRSSADCIFPDSVRSGFLGYDRTDVSADENIEVPRNIAVLASGIVDETSNTGMEVALVETSVELLSARAGASGSCSGGLAVALGGWPSDDHTSRESLVYVVYAGSTLTEAMGGSDRRSIVYSPTLARLWCWNRKCRAPSPARFHES